MFYVTDFVPMIMRPVPEGVTGPALLQEWTAQAQGEPPEVSGIPEKLPLVTDTKREAVKRSLGRNPTKTIKGAKRGKKPKRDK